MDGAPEAAEPAMCLVCYVLDLERDDIAFPGQDARALLDQKQSDANRCRS